MQDCAKICATCTRSWFREDGNMACGAGVNVTAHPDPIWASRKYSFEGVMAMLAADGRQDLDGFDCENMSPVDGLQCRAWEKRVMTQHRLESDYERLPLAINRVARAWMNDVDKIPRGVTVEISEIRSFDRQSNVSYPIAGFVEAAARYLAPEWEVSVEVYLSADGVGTLVLLKKYEGEVSHG